MRRVLLAFLLLPGWASAQQNYTPGTGSNSNPITVQGTLNQPQATPSGLASMTIASANTWQSLFTSAAHGAKIQNNSTSCYICIGETAQTGSISCAAGLGGAQNVVLIPPGAAYFWGQPQPAFSLAASSTTCPFLGNAY